MSSQKWKELAEKRRLVEQYYKEKDKAIKDYKFRRGASSDFYEKVAKPVPKKIGEQIKKKKKEQAEKMIEQIQGLPGALVKINKPMIEYEKEGETLRGIEKEEMHYVNLDRGTTYDAIKEFPNVSALHLLGSPEEWREARKGAGKEKQRLAPHVAKTKKKMGAGKPITKEEENDYNRRHALDPYITNIKALEENQATIGKGTGFQISRHPYKMTKSGKYGKLTVDVPQLVEKHRLLATEAGVVLLDEKKLILILLILLVKDIIQKRNTPIYQKLYSKH